MTKTEAGARRPQAAGIEGIALAVNGKSQNGKTAKKSTYRYRGGNVAIDTINVLSQPRQTFENIDILAIDVAGKGLIEPPAVARFTRRQCQAYVDKVNTLRQTSHRVDDLVAVRERGRKVFYVLLAGERRLRAVKLLTQEGCLVCQEEYGKGPCYARHFGNSLLEVRLCVKIPPLEALFLQMSENTHMRVPVHEEAKAYSQLYRLIRSELDPNYTLTAFARQVGRSPSTIRNALRFCALPESIQAQVESGDIAYGIALELARLQERNIPSAELEWLVLYSITSQARVDTFRQIVDQWLADCQSGQLSLVALMDESQEKARRRAVVRQTVASNAVKSMWQLIDYFRRVSELFKQGKLGTDDSPFSEKSPVRLFREVVRQLEEVSEHLNELVPKGERRRIRQKISQAKSVADDVLALELITDP